MQVIVHGGAGGQSEEPERRQEVLDGAAETGAAQPTPLDAVEAAVRVLESDPRFNAGVGGARQSDGAVRTCAGVMTADREVGAAAGMVGVEHAVTVARVVHQKTPHVLVAGGPAVSLAEAFDVETAVDLTTERTRERWAAADPPAGSPRDHLPWVRGRFGDDPDGPERRDGDAANGAGTADDGSGDPLPDDRGDPPADDRGTVGAVAREGEALAAATSTGGRWFALTGRVGDVPQVGSGFYCAPAGGASATGAGEDIARATVARRAVGHLEAGLDAQRAAARTIEEFAELTGSGAGVVVLDGSGAGSAFNTSGMQTAVVTD